MSHSLGPSSAARSNPEHTIEIAAGTSIRRATLGDRLLASSDAALVVYENGYAPVIYFPPQDVDTDALKLTESATNCPFKGQARYFALSSDPDSSDIAWQYPNVYDEVAAIAGYIAFYSDKVTISGEDQ